MEDEDMDLLGKAAVYRQHAEDVRDRAQRLLPEGRKKLLEIAEEWERMADEETRRPFFSESGRPC